MTWPETLAVAVILPLLVEEALRALLPLLARPYSLEPWPQASARAEILANLLILFPHMKAP